MCTSPVAWPRFWRDAGNLSISWSRRDLKVWSTLRVASWRRASKVGLLNFNPEPLQLDDWISLKVHILSPNWQVDHMAPFSPVANTWSGIIISALTPASRGFFPCQDGGRLRFRRLGWHIFASKSDDIILIVSLHPSENLQGSPKYLPTAHPITRRVAEVFTMLAGLLGNMAGRHSLKVEGCWPIHKKEHEP